jgi:serine protease Do
MKHTILLIILLCNLFATAQDLSELYEKVSPAVVVILTQQKELIQTSNNTSRMVDQDGLGSGFMISDRLVVTAAHVVTVPEKIQVLFPDGDVIPATVESIYKGADIALIRLFRPRINPVTVSFGDSDALKIGERIFVIGAPFGLDASLSSGYVSSFRRQGNGQNPFTTSEFIQTDAAINTGNSGGPMFNMKGEVVGIVSYIITKSGGFEGIGYAATSNLAARLLLNNKMPWLGADLKSLTEKQTNILNVPQKEAILVERIVTESIFGQMGVKGGNTEANIWGMKLILGGDIILAVNDIRYNTSEDTLNKLAEFAGSVDKTSPVKLTILRQGKIITLERK